MTTTLQRDSSAELTSKDGFSVVAPMRMMSPDSTYDRNASCWALLKRWISSMKTIVFDPRDARAFRASSISALMSLMEVDVAEKGTKRARVVRAMMRASVVFPEPGGPQKIMEGMRSDSMAL